MTSKLIIIFGCLLLGFAVSLIIIQMAKNSEDETGPRRKASVDAGGGGDPTFGNDDSDGGDGD